MFTAPHCLQVVNPVVLLVSVDVVDDISGREGTVVVFPYLDVLKLPSTVRLCSCSAWERPA
jgi:hypothetical protein